MKAMLKARGARIHRPNSATSIFLALGLILAVGAVANAHPLPPRVRAALTCRHGGYLTRVGVDGQTFSSQATCVSYALHGGRFVTGAQLRNAHQCQKGGFLSLVGANGTTFPTVRSCMRFAARGGHFSTGMVIPAGKTATISGASFGDFTTNCPLDPDTYGYQLNMRVAVTVDSHPAQQPGHSLCTSAKGATVGPFRTATLLRIWLYDPIGRAATFYSDGRHAIHTGRNPRMVSIMDSKSGTFGPSVRRVPATIGTGDQNATVTIG